MKIDLCKLLGIEEGEEFKVNGKDTIYFITDNVLQYKINSYHSKVSNLKVNEIITITKLPKKKRFSQDTLNFFKCIDKKFDWIAKDNNGDVCIYTNKPNKKRISWSLDFVGVGCRAEIYGFDKSLFDQILWEDEEAVHIGDYVERN